MKGFSAFYIEALIACIMIFGVLLAHNHYNMDRQELDGVDAPYALSLSLGYDVLAGEGDTIHDCFQRADDKLYEDKRQSR